MPRTGICRLLGAVQHYAWGGDRYIPTLVGLPAQPGVTYAEYWMGAHSGASSRVVLDDGTAVSLNEVISQQPAAALGATVAQRYGRLPYLFKILDVREMLSIQVHPTKAEAEIGFARENQQGIPLDAPQRNYKDDNHKPELEVAISEFWMLHGFRPQDQLHALLRETPELRDLDPILSAAGYRGLYQHVMELPQPQADAILSPLVARVLQEAEQGEVDETSPDYWVAGVVRERQAEPLDRGIFSIYFFNLVRLRPGQAIYQDAGVPHALLRGQALEIMANSDNTVRGGLTPKYVDVPELLRLVHFDGITPAIIEATPGSTPHELVYATPSREFRLSKMPLKLGDSVDHAASSIDILFALDGDAGVVAAGAAIAVTRGESVLAFAGNTYRVTAGSEDSLVFRASVPDAEA